MEEEEIDRGSQNSMRELQDVFIPTVLNGFDLYDSYTALLHYLFGPRKLIDVVDSAMRMKRHEKMVKEALDVLEHNVINPLRQMLKNLRAQKPVEVHNRLELAYEVYKAYDKHFPETDVCAATEDFFSEVNIMFKTGQISMDWLPEVVLTMFGKSAAFKYAEIPLSRDSAFFEAQQSPVSHCPFTNSFNKAYELLKTGSSDLYANLIKFYFDNNTTIEKEDAISMLETLFSNKDLVLSDANRHWTLAILEKICVNVAADIKRSVFMEAQTQLYAGGFEPKPISNIAMRVAKAVNGIKSHNSVQSDPAAFEALRTELRFLVLIAPKAALHGLFHRCFNNKDSVPAVMKVLQGMQEACNLPVDYRQKTVPMLLVVVDMLIQELRDRLKHPDFTETVSYILGALCRQKRSLIKEKGEGGKFLRSVLGDVVEEYLIKPNQILSHIILPRLFAENKADGELKMVLTALKKILTSIGEKEAPLKYLTKLDVTRIDRVPVPQLICYIHVTMRQSEKTDEEITDICFGVLKALGNKLKEDDVIFPDETKEYLLSKLKNDVWWFRYAVTEWFGHSLGNVPKEIPGGLFHSLDTEVRNNFKELKVDFETAPVGCMLLSLFELALVDVDLADSLLLTGFGTLPSDDLLLDQMAMALCDCCIKSFFSRRIASILPFLDRLMVILDPRAPIPFPMNEVNDNMLQAVRETKAIQILGRATRMSIAKIYHSDSRFLVYYPQASPECPTNPREVADVLLRAFCQLAIEQVNRQIELYRRQKRSREKSKDSDRDSHRLEERLLTQMVVLFQDAVLFTRCEMSKHQALDVLLNRLAEYIREVQAGNRKTTLEHVKIEHKKTTYVHIDRPKDVEPQAVAEPQTTNQTPTKKYLDPHYSHPRQRNVSGHQRPFKYPPNLNRNDQTWKHRGGGGYRGLDGATTAMKAAAHQIPNENTRNQVERRLNEPPAPPPPSRPPSAPQQQQQSTGSQATIQRPPRYHGGQQNRGGRGRGRHQNFRLHPQHS